MIGRELLAECAITLRWATAATVDHLIQYLELAFLKPDDHQAAVREAEYGDLLSSAGLAFRIGQFERFLPRRLDDSYFDWLPRLPEHYVVTPLLHVAFLMNTDMAIKATEFVNANPEDPRTEWLRLMRERRERRPA